MGTRMEEGNLIFLISQPRSGSSMLQQILMQDEAILSFPEPWFMLPLIYTFKYPGINSLYNLDYANINFLEYLGRFDGGVQQFKHDIKDLALKLYGLSLPERNQMVLDKTPRYYHIAEELNEMFPGSKFIFLIRNPAAVFSSILSYNFSGSLVDFLRSPDRHADLMTAPKIINSIKHKKRRNTMFVNYESIVLQTEKTLLEVSEFLGINTLSCEYELDTAFGDSRGVDKKSVGKHTRPVLKYLDSWKSGINTDDKKEMLLKYITALGEQLLSDLGYEYTSIIENITRHPV